MNQFVILVLLFIAFPAWLSFRRWSSRRQRLPPGPLPLPVIGNILQLGRNPSRSLANLAQTHGPLMSLQLGSIYAVVVSSPETAKAVLQKHDAVFSGRSVPAAVRVHDHHNISISTIPLGEEWRKLRKICREKLFSSVRLDASEGLRRERLEKLRAYVGECSDGGRTMDIGEAAFVTMLNLMWATLFSNEFTSYGSDANQELKETVNGITRYIGVPNVADFFPILERFDPQGIKRKVEFYIGKLLSIIGDLIDQRLKSRSSTPHYQKKINDLLETLLDISEEGDYDLSLKQIKHLISDLIVAGSDTTSTTTEWAITELLLNPEKLSKAKRELKRVIGEKNEILESDISRLPYLKAVVKEVLRCHPPAPLLAPHKTEEDVQLNGYIMPQDTTILINVWAITRDPSLWPNPNTFEPERFLDKNIDFKGQDFELIPFGSGRRICPGLPLANRMLHILVATLIHKVEWKFEVGGEGKETHRKDVFGLTLQKAFPLKAIPMNL